MEATIRVFNVLAEIRVTSFSRADPAWLLDVDCFSSERALSVEKSLKSSLQLTDGDLCLPCPPSSYHSAASLGTVGIELQGELERGKLAKYLDAVLFGKSLGTDVTVFRVKGMLRIANERYIHILQAVHEVFDIQPCDLPAENYLSSKVVLIGRNLNKFEIESGFRACLR